MTKFEQSFWGQKGYDELRKLSRQGNELCKEVGNILNERSKIEHSYAEQLSKLSIKANKLGSKDMVGTFPSSWEKLCKEMENEAELHKLLGNQIHDEGYKQMKTFVESQTKTRKAIEATVDKAYKAYNDKLNDSLKTKKNSYLKSKEAENLEEQLDDIRLGPGKGKAVSDKDIQKLETKIKKSKDAVFKIDQEYRDFYQKAERARLEWESSMSKYCQTCQTLEEERIKHLKETFSLYVNMLAAVAPQIQQIYEDLQQESQKIQPEEDVKLMADTKGMRREEAEQILYDCFEEDLESNMNFNRRKEALERKIKVMTIELEKEKKAKEGIKTLFDGYAHNPEFTSQELQQDVSTQMNHANAVIDSLQASLYKLQYALARLCGNEEPTHQLSNYIKTTRDKQGIALSVLRIPVEMVANYSHEQYEDHIDDFDDDIPADTVLCHCKALYEFNGEQSDQLTIRPGQVINVLEKMNDGWWRGEVNNIKGYFPESYVEEI